MYEKDGINYIDSFDTENSIYDFLVDANSNITEQFVTAPQAVKTFIKYYGYKRHIKLEACQNGHLIHHIPCSPGFINSGKKLVNVAKVVPFDLDELTLQPYSYDIVIKACSHGCGLYSIEYKKEDKIVSILTPDIVEFHFDEN